MEKVQLPKEFRDNWLEALRSGKYKQGTGFLHWKGEYCCLGVACKVLDIPEEAMSDFGEPNSIQHPFDKLIPEPLKQNKRFYMELIDQNDNENFSFSKIADWIEENTVPV